MKPYLARKWMTTDRTLAAGLAVLTITDAARANPILTITIVFTNRAYFETTSAKITRPRYPTLKARKGIAQITAATAVFSTVTNFCMAVL